MKKFLFLIVLLVTLGFAVRKIARSPEPDSKADPRLFSMNQIGKMMPKVAVKARKPEKPPKQASEAKTQASPPTLSRIEEILQKDDACALVHSQYDSETLSKALLERSTSVRLRTLFSEDGPMKGQVLPSRDEVILFYNALLYSNLLAGVRFDSPDFRYSLRILEELRTRDPGNGAYDLYSAMVLDKLGQPIEEQRIWVNRALQAPHYNTFIMDIVQTVHQDLIQNATLWIAVIDFLSKIPIPETPMPNYFRKIFPNPTVDESRRIAAFGLRLNQRPQSIAIEMAIGKHLVEKFTPRSEKLPPLKDYREELDTIDIAGPLNQESCQRMVLDQEYERHRKEGWNWR